MPSPSDASDHARSVARRLGWAVLAPVVVLLALGGGLAVQIRSLIGAFDAARESRAIVAELHQLQKLILDQETGLRGFLLSGDRAFLEPYERADTDGSFRTLRAMVAGDPRQRERLDEVRRNHEAWLAAAQRRTAAAC